MLATEDGEQDWLFFQRGTAGDLGKEPLPSQVKATPGESVPDDTDPRARKKGTDKIPVVPLDYDSPDDAGKVLFVLTNVSVDTDGVLQCDPACFTQLADGGYCPVPQRLFPDGPGDVPAPDTPYLAFGVPRSFAPPNAGWEGNFGKVCAGNRSGIRTLREGPCSEAAGVGFVQDLLGPIATWMRDFPHAAAPADRLCIPGVPEESCRLRVWENGTAPEGASQAGLTCAAGSDCPTGAFFVPLGTGGRARRGHFRLSTTLLSDPKGQRNRAAADRLRTLAHEIFHNLQGQWIIETGVSGFYRNNRFIEPTPEAIEQNLCLPRDLFGPAAIVEQLPECVSASRLTPRARSLGSDADRLFQFPEDGLFVATEPRQAMLFYRYLLEQYAEARFTEAHPGGTESALPRPPGGQDLFNSRPDEGMDMMGHILAAFDDNERLIAGPCNGPGSEDDSFYDRMGCVTEEHLGRSFEDVMLDFHTALVLKDYAEVDRRWLFRWVGDFNASPNPAPLPLQDSSGAPDVRTPNTPLREDKPFVDMTNGAGWVDAFGVLPDDLPRVRRVHDSWTPPMGFATPEPVELAAGETVDSSATPVDVHSYGSAYVSTLLESGFTGTIEVFVAPKSDSLRFRVFTIDSDGEPHLAPRCVPTSCPRESDGTVRVPVIVFSDTREILLVASGGRRGGQFDWRIGPDVPRLDIISPTLVKPTQIGEPTHPLPFRLLFTVTDEDGQPLESFTEDGLQVLVNNVLLDQKDYTLLGDMSGGKYIAVVTVPPSAYPMPFGFVDLEIRHRDAPVGDTELDALQGLSSGTRPFPTATVFVLDLSRSMADSFEERDNLGGKIRSLRRAGRLFIDAERDGVDRIGAVRFAHHAASFPGFEDLPLSTPGIKDMFKTALDDAIPAGNTSLGDGLFQAQDVLDEAALGFGVGQSMIVVSDGLSNCDWSPEIYMFGSDVAGVADPTEDGPNDPGCTVDHLGEDGCRCPNDNVPDWGGREPFKNSGLVLTKRSGPVPTIFGLGVGGNADMDALTALADLTGGVAFHVDELMTETQISLDASNFTTMATAGILGEQRITGRKAVSLPVEFDVEPGTAELRVSLLSRGVGLRNIELVGPDANDAPIEFPVRGDDDTGVLRVANPDDGTWIVRQGDIVVPELVEPELKSVRRFMPDPDDGLREPTGGAEPEIFIEAAVQHPLTLIANADVGGTVKSFTTTDTAVGFDDGRVAGRPILLQAVVHEASPVLAASIDATIETPAGVVHTIALRDDGANGDGAAGNGAFGAIFEDTVEPGTYQVNFTATGVSPVSGATFHRERRQSVALREPPDGDGDGLPDFWELRYGLNPTVDNSQSDSDGDGLSDPEEFAARTSPASSDSDGGGESDASEIAAGRDPSDPSDDVIKSPAVLVFPGNGQVFLDPGMAVADSTTIEIQREDPDGTFSQVFSGELTGELIPIPGNNGVEVCLRARVRRGQATSGWSSVQCATPGEDPLAPRLEVTADCAPGDQGTLTLSASDPVALSPHTDDAPYDPTVRASGVTQMRVLEEGQSVPFIPFETTVAVDLDGAKTKTFTVQVRDAAGNVSNTATVEVTRCSGVWPMFGRTAGHGANSSLAGPSTANLQWSFDTRDEVRSSPAIASNGTVYIGSDDHRLYAINPDGSQKWARKTGGRVDSSPALSPDEQTVYVGSHDDNLYAISTEDGSVLWQRELGDRDVESSPAVAPDGTIVVGGDDNKLHALQPTDGSVLWVFPTGRDVDSSPAISQAGVVYAGSDDHRVYAIDLETGQEIWRFSTGDDVDSSPALSPEESVLYVGSDDHHLYALSAENGDRIWRADLGLQVDASPAVGPDGTIYVGSDINRVVALDPVDGSEIWSVHTGGDIKSSPAIGADGIVYVGSDDDRIRALDGATGDELWRYDTDRDVKSSPAIGPGGVLVVGSDSGLVYAFNRLELGTTSQALSLSDPERGLSLAGGCACSLPGRLFPPGAPGLGAVFGVGLGCALKRRRRTARPRRARRRPASTAGKN